MVKTLLEPDKGHALADIGLAERVVLEPGELQVVGVPGSVSVKSIEVVVRTGQVEILPGDHRRSVLVMEGGVLQSRAPVAFTAVDRSELIVRYLPH
jgi:hypothetical protein